MDTSRVSDVQREWEYLTLATFLLKPDKTCGDASFTLSLISQSSPLSPLACFGVARTSVSNWLQDLDVDGPARRQQRFQPLQDLAGQVELAPKVEPMLGGTMAIEPPHRLVSQIEPEVDRGRKVPDAQGTFEVAKGLVVAGLARGGFVVIVEPVDRLDVCGVLVLLAERVIEVDVKDFGQTPCSGQLQQPRDLVVPEGVACFRGGPGTDFLARVQNLSRMPFFDSRGDVQRGLKITTALQTPLAVRRRPALSSYQEQTSETFS